MRNSSNGNKFWDILQNDDYKFYENFIVCNYPTTLMYQFLFFLFSPPFLPINNYDRIEVITNFKAHPKL
jgi:hypothetical protein